MHREHFIAITLRMQRSRARPSQNSQSTLAASFDDFPRGEGYAQTARRGQLPSLKQRPVLLFQNYPRSESDPGDQLINALS
jgi:hypothetical protein